jgi:predicted Rossmann fold nucleotide-binding protein DprA/Smf involved in DNA uptake
MKELPPTCINPGDAHWPRLLAARLGTSAPEQLSALGNLDLLALPKTAIFCSARCPGHVILTAYDQAAKWREAGRCVISGFHSPIEKECLRILLRGSQPIIICPARAIEAMRIPIELRTAFDAGRVLYLSPFAKQPRRVTKESALRRNEAVAALADEAYVAHVAEGGQTALISKMLAQWGVLLV